MLPRAVKCPCWQLGTISIFKCGSACRMACQKIISGASSPINLKLLSLFPHLPGFLTCLPLLTPLPTPAAVVSYSLPLNYFPYTSGISFSPTCSPFSPLCLTTSVLQKKKRLKVDPLSFLFSQTNL